MKPVDLSQNTPEAIEYMIGKIVEKLKMVNVSAIRSNSLDEEKYEELRDIYEMVMSKQNFSPSQMQAIAEEIGRLRKVQS